MNKVLIADDENLSCDILSNYIPWSKYDCEVVAICKDGKEAYDCALELMPHIIITDIKMPKMDGIELLERLKAILPNSTYILVTAYDDKHYLKSAIKLHVSGFIEKPFNMEEINTLLESIMANINKKNELINAEKRLIAKKLLSSLININNKQDVNKIVHSYNIISNNKQRFSLYDDLLCLIIKPYFYNKAENHFDLSILINAFEEYLLENNIFSVSDNFEFNNIVSILSFDNLNSNEICNIIYDFLKTFKNEGFYISISMGQIINDYNNFNDSYKTAKDNLFRLFYSFESCIINPYMNINYPSFDSNYFLALTNNICSSIKSINKEETIKATDMLFEELKKYQSTPIGEVKNIFLGLVYSYKNICTDLNIKNYTDIFIDIPSKITRSEYLFEIKEIIESLSYNLLKEIEDKYDNKTVCDELIHYIDNNIGDINLSIKSLADHFYISQSYLCCLFKKETGTTINKYIIDKRMSLARKLLEKSNLNIYEIANKVGFSDSKYFSKLFKNHFGVLPKKIREHGIK